MPFDGLVTKCVALELNSLLTGGRIEKVTMPEPDGVVLSVRSNNVNFRLLLSANASMPRIHLTSSKLENPAVPSGFCMLLRKHLTAGRLISFEVSDYERIVAITIEAVNELGDSARKKLIIEIMGKHSNIILVNSSGVILDAVKHIDSSISSVREVMPARVYTLPPAQNKADPENPVIASILAEAGAVPVFKAILNGLMGYSPLLSRELCLRAGVSPDIRAADISAVQTEALQAQTDKIASDIAGDRFHPCMIYADSKNEKPMDFHCLEIKYVGVSVPHGSISEVIDDFYEESARLLQEKQKKSSIARILSNTIVRIEKKILLHEEKIRELADMESLRLAGELITANLHDLKDASGKANILNYYTNEMTEIRLDPELNAVQNAQKYFHKYSKAKRSLAGARKQLEEARTELDYLESVSSALENSATVQEISEIREELAAQGYVSVSAGGKKKAAKKLPPHEFTSSDGFTIYVGRNNTQNDLLTLKSAGGGDMWLHTRNIPGSHVILVKKGDTFSDRAIFEASSLAAGYSKARMSQNVPVDHALVKFVKKPPGAKPGKVIYSNFKTLNVDPAKSVDEIQTRK